MSEVEKSQRRKSDAEVGQIHVDTGVISPEEERRRIIQDPESLYLGLNPEDVPDLLEEEISGGLEPVGGRPDPKAEGEPDNPDAGADDDVSRTKEGHED